MKAFKLIVLMLSLAALAAFAVDPSLNPAADYVLDGPTAFTAGPGVTNVYSGLISGTGPAIIEGGGTVAFSHANNTYTGGTTINDAVFRLDADGCAGSGAITGAVNTAHVFMNCANVPNDMVFMQAYSTKTQLDPSGYPAAGQCCILPLQPDVTVKGHVKLNGASYLFNETDPALVSAPTVTYEKGISNSSYIFTVPKGRMIFKGRYVSTYNSRSRLGVISSARGSMEFRASSNELWRLDYYNADMDFKAVDAFPTSLFHYEYGENNSCKTYLNGNDQTVLGFSWGTDSAKPQPTETGTGQCWTSEDNPASVRITGCAPSRTSGTFVNRLALFGKITLVMDVDPTYTAQGFFQDFSDRRSTTTGDLVVSNGDFRVSGIASFPNVPNIYVGTGGSFTNASTKQNAFAGCRNLTVLGKMACTGDATPFTDRSISMTLGEDAEFSLPAGATLTVLSLKVGGQAKPDGMYGDGGTHLDQIKRGTVIVRSGNFYVDCVNGNDANSGAFGSPFKTIAAATAVAESGDTIHVAPGIYGEGEGSQKYPDATSEIGTRVIIQDGVTLESTEGAEKTFIVGSVSPNPGVTEGWQTGVGPGAVRCVVAGNGATLRGFTLTGGYTHDNSNANSEDRFASAFYSSGGRTATIEDCIVSNNVAAAYTIYQAVVRRCRVIGNTSSKAPGASNNSLAPGGFRCSWYNTVIADNRGNATLSDTRACEGCTIGYGNIQNAKGTAAEVIQATTCPIVNSAILDGYCGGSATFHLTNCLVSSTSTSWANLPRYNTIITNETGAAVDAEYRPILGSFAGIDKGDAAYSTASLGDTDLFGNQRVMNGALDIGAVEYDWRPEFSAELGRRFKVGYASPSVTTNADGGLLVVGGEVSGKVTSPGTYEIAFDVTAGSLAVYVGGELADESSGTGEQSIRFKVADIADEVRFVVAEPGAVILGSCPVISGFSIIFR